MHTNYKGRIDKVIRYIEDNSHRKLSLDLLAGVAGFSKYHFIRLFTAVAGVTPIAYVNRVRLQRAVYLLTDSESTILEISSACGFESVSAFHALFRKYYDQSPSEVRSALRQNSNYLQYLSNKPDAQNAPEDYTRNRNNSLRQRAWDAMITIREIPGYEVAYVRHVGSYLDTGQAWDKLQVWAGSQGLTPPGAMFIGISLDDPNVTDEFACRYDACVTLPPGGASRVESAGPVQCKTLSGGLYAVYPYYGKVEQFVLAYQTVFGLWLPDSGYEADDRPCLEFCLQDHAKEADGKCKVDLYVPVKRRGV
ncbi:AraC family transcriptional regulator ['Paenibacillus yunnanensis' Narsing Rao et al. 2020]|uniref:AraC family transcriptional regulator n=1 Tax=Paenibacillus tengchongensis TaxID=2608684 RepID=UPI00124DCC26|nr:AraC family transcriptional regulator [Paenibacillus tengchongensis]